MRVLTVRQPWAWAIIHAGKDIENRTRNLAGSYRGPVAIHAGLQEDDDAYADDLIKAAFAEYEDSWQLLDEMPSGVVLGVVDLVDVHIETPTCCSSPWAQRVTRYDENPLHHLQVARPRAFVQPVPAKGRLGLWRPDADLLAAIVGADPVLA